MKPLFALILGTATLGWAAVCQADPVSLQTVHTNKSRFRIPYRYDAAEMKSLGAKEIRLYASTDRGLRWQHIQTVKPQAGRFNFEAVGDGEYWFAVRTLDGRNRLHPTGNLVEPELTVVVDTTAPRLEVSLRQLEAGKVQLAWRASDQNLDPTKLRLEYIQSGSADWQPVSVVPQASGQTAWTVQRGGMVAVRGSISDLANNMADAQSQVRVESAPQGVPELPASDYRQPIANSNQQRFPASQFSSGVNRPVSPPPQDPFSAFSNQPARTHRNPASAGMGSTAITPMPFNQFVSSQPDARPDVFQPRYPATPEVGRDLQPRSNGRIVNSRTFEIGYQVEQVGPSGVGSVEMYITQDNGRKWYKYGADPDHVSPFRIDVPQEGMYGFALRVLSGVGMSDNPPQAGDQPEIVIAVDTTPPIVNLLPVQQGQGVSLNTMLVRWQASDAHPADKSIAISYAVTAAGPWQPIDGWLSNSGSYLWTVGVKAPPKIYLRLSARDAAGNIAHTVSSQPIIVDMSKPSARFVDVESINFAPRGQKK